MLFESERKRPLPRFIVFNFQHSTASKMKSVLPQFTAMVGDFARLSKTIATKTLILLAFLLGTSHSVHAEKRAIFVWITRTGTAQKLIANIESGERDEQKRNISLTEAADI